MTKLTNWETTVSLFTDDYKVPLLPPELAAYMALTIDHTAWSGPTGARQLIENLERAYALDITIRVADEKLPLSGIATDVTEFDCDGTIYERGGVKVIAFEVDHGDVIKPCYGYRFEYGGRVAVLSSDTRYNHNVLKYGRSPARRRN